MSSPNLADPSLAGASLARTSLALANLRGFVIVVVLAFHSVLAYLSYAPAAARPFNDPPYRWLSFPIVDSERWFGFDLFCALQDLYLISLMFFLSGLFVWRSLVRKGSLGFLADRLVRLALPLALTVLFLMPVAHYPAYRVSAVDPSLAAYWQHWLALPFWPAGPAWFLGVLLAFDIAAAALFAVARGAGDALARLCVDPARFVFVLICASALAYVPLALALTPWEWVQNGPFSFQLSRPLHYAVYFFAGVGTGALGFERGLFANGWLAQRWRGLLAAAVGTYVAWLASTGLVMMGPQPPALGAQILSALCFVLSCGAGTLCALALVMRFADRPVPAVAIVGDRAYGLYLIHYVFVVWLQYLLLGLAMYATGKAIIVLGGTLFLSLATVSALRRIPAAGRIIGSEPRGGEHPVRPRMGNPA
jgi:glucans biosynthesis protein C